MLKNVDWKNVLERAIWTFVEGFLLAIPIINPGNIEGLINGSWKLILAGAIGAGLSAVKTFILDIIQQSKNKQIAKEIEPEEYGDVDEYFEREDDKEDDEK